MLFQLFVIYLLLCILHEAGKKSPSLPEPMTEEEEEDFDRWVRP